MQDPSNKKKSIDDYSIISVVGKGSYAKVFLVKDVHTGKLHAMKVLKKEKIEQKKQENHVKVERDVLINIDHPFVIKFDSSFQNDKKLYFVLEYCHGMVRESLLTFRWRVVQPLEQEEKVQRGLNQVLRSPDGLGA